MAVELTDDDIRRLLEERKPLPTDFRKRMTLKPKRAHREGELSVRGVDGSSFRLILRQADANPMDFSIILRYDFPKSNKVFRLRRYNGRREHTNRLEGETFYGFHVHKATERYQDLGFDEDTYAELTDRYSDFEGAVECMLKDCGFDVPDDPQMSLFGGEE